MKAMPLAPHMVLHGPWRGLFITGSEMLRSSLCVHRMSAGQVVPPTPGGIIMRAGETHSQSRSPPSFSRRAPFCYRWVCDFTSGSIFVRTSLLPRWVSHKCLGLSSASYARKIFLHAFQSFDTSSMQVGHHRKPLVSLTPTFH